MSTFGQAIDALMHRGAASIRRERWLDARVEKMHGRAMMVAPGVAGSPYVWTPVGDDMRAKDWIIELDDGGGVSHG